MSSVLITIPGKPFAKQRPRFSRASGRAYTPKETVQFEDVVRQIASREVNEPFQGPVEVCVAAFFEPPKSWSKKKRAELMHQTHTQRPDLDNIVKAITDGLNRIAYADDSQIYYLMAEKRWAPEAQTVIYVSSIATQRRK